MYLLQERRYARLWTDFSIYSELMAHLYFEFNRSTLRPHNGTGVTVEPPDPEQAWNTLSLMNGWIRHADAKAGVTLAFTGALSALVFNLAQAPSTWNALTITSVTLSCALLFAAAVLCGMTLTPRTHDKSGESERGNLLFFAKISRDYTRQQKEYRKALSDLSADPIALVGELADQVHANALVATNKTRWAKWAVRAALVASAAVAALAFIIGVFAP